MRGRSTDEFILPVWLGLEVEEGAAAPPGMAGLLTAAFEPEERGSAAEARAVTRRSRGTEQRTLQRVGTWFAHMLARLMNHLNVTRIQILCGKQAWGGGEGLHCAADKRPCRNAKDSG